MPCLFEEPQLRQAKAIHAAIARASVMRFADGTGVAFAGDFNTKPEDSELEVLQSAMLGPSDKAHPPNCGGLSLSTWLAQDNTRRLRSAYAAFCGSEPNFTNYAWIEKEPHPFQATLDYIFVSDDLSVEGVRPLPDSAPEEVFPSASEPSDHLMLAADILLGGQSPPK